MDKSLLKATAKALVAPGKGILAADESTRTAGKRLASIGLDNTEENRRNYRQMLFTAKGWGEYISGVILFDETLRQSTADGVKFTQLMDEEGVIPGIKVDEGLVDIEGTDGEKVTQGLESLPNRLPEYFDLGARFAKWRAVYAVTDDLPSETAIMQNASCLAKYAKACQDASIVPIIEPEVMMDGEHTTHSLERCYDVTKKVQEAVFAACKAEGVYLEGVLLKPNMVIPGQDCPVKATTEEVAEATVKCLKATVPAEVPGIVFLSGGQGDVEATENLNAMNKLGNVPWALSFSYGRALQAAALKTWGGSSENILAAQREFLKRAACNSAATRGTYSKAMEQKEFAPAA